MSKNFAAAGIITGLFLAYTPAGLADDNGWYTGFGIGSTSADVVGLTAQDIGNFGVFDSVTGFSGSKDDSDTGWKLYGGYQYNRNLAVELLYTDLGEFSRSGSGDAVYSGSPATYSTKSTVESSGFGITALGILPVAERFHAFGKLGVFRWSADLETTVTGSVGGTPVASIASADDDGTEFTFGIGGSYSFTDMFRIRFEWERFNSIGSDTTISESDIDLFSANAELRLPK